MEILGRNLVKIKSYVRNNRALSELEHSCKKGECLVIDKMAQVIDNPTTGYSTESRSVYAVKDFSPRFITVFRTIRDMNSGKILKRKFRVTRTFDY